MAGFWIVPTINELSPKGYQLRRPKYFWTPSAIQTAPDLVASGMTGSTTHAQCDAGDSFIVYSPDETVSVDTFLAAQVDCVTVPPLDTLITAGAVGPTKTALENLGLPAQWVNAGMSYRFVLRACVGLVQLAQRMSGLGHPLSLTGKLNNLISTLPAATQTALFQACDDLGIDRTNILPSTTLRAALVDFGTQFEAGHIVTLGTL